MTKINYTKFLKNNPEDIIHKDKNNYYVIRNFENVKKKVGGGLFGSGSTKTEEGKRKVYIILRKTDDKSFEEIFKDMSYDKTKSMYNKLRTLNGDNFIVKYNDGKYIFKDLTTGYKFGEYSKISEVKKVIKDKYEDIYKFKNYTDILDKMVKHDDMAKNIGKNIKTKKYGVGKIGTINLKLK